MKKSSKFQKLNSLLESGFIQQELMSVAAEIAAAASTLAPKDTGALEESIHHEKTSTGAKVITEDEAGITQEFGTVRHGAQPFMRVAFEKKAVEGLTQIEKRIEMKLKTL